MNNKKEVKLSWRDLNIDYNVDFLTVAQIAEKYSIEWSDAKKALRDYGFTIRMKEPKPTEPTKDYTVVLVDSDKIVTEDVAKANTNSTTVVA